MGMTYKDILKEINEYIEKHRSQISVMKKYRDYSKNKVGVFHKNRIIKNLRLEDKISKIISEDGTLTLGGNKSSDLTIIDVLVEDTLPKAAVETLKTFTVGEKPKIIVKEENRKWVKDFELREDIHGKMKKIVHDILVVGDSFFKVEKNNSKAEVIILKKENIILVPDNWNDTKTGLYIYCSEKENCLNKKYNYVEVFESTGKIHILKNTNGKDFVKVDDEKTNGDVNVGLGEFTIHHVKGISEHENSLYSDSIYEGLTSTFIECTTRLTGNSTVFNDYGNPKMVGSEDLSEKNEFGETVVESRNYIQATSEEGARAFRYIAPPTDHINATYPHIKIMVDNAYRQLGVNEISLGLAKEGGIASGESYKKAITPTLNKCRDIANNLYVPFINLYKQAYKIETGKDLEIEIEFQDGISLSEKEIIDNEKSLVEAKLISRSTILKNRGIENPEEELKRIAEEDKLLNPVFGEADIPSGINE